MSSFFDLSEQLAALGAVPGEGLGLGLGVGEGEGGERGAAPPPGGNTGGKLTAGEIRVGQDWLNVTFPLSNLGHVRELVEGFIGPAKDRDKGSNTYAQSAGWESGAILAWTEGRSEAWLSLNGDTCDLILPELKLELLHGLKRLGAKGTRVDAKLDVARDLVSMDQVHAAAEAAQVVGFRRYDPRRVIGNMETREVVEDQARFGRRGKDGSGKFVRVYDKGLESDGDLDCIRIEVELSGDLARAWFDVLCLCQSVEDLVKHLGRIVTSSIAFADKSGAHHHADRFECLEWWERIINRLGVARLAVQRVKRSLERTAEWGKCVLPRLLARLRRAADAQGMDGLALVMGLARELLNKGEAKLSWAPPPASDELIDFRFVLGT